MPTQSAVASEIGRKELIAIQYRVDDVARNLALADQGVPQLLLLCTLASVVQCSMVHRTAGLGARACDRRFALLTSSDIRRVCCEFEVLYA